MNKKFALLVLSLVLGSSSLIGCNKDPGEAMPPTQEELKNDSATEAPPGGPGGA